jgi:hypothetical protein
MVECRLVNFRHVSHWIDCPHKDQSRKFDEGLTSVADPHRKNADADAGKNLNADADPDADPDPDADSCSY